jgi:hypothetical protein
MEASPLTRQPPPEVFTPKIIQLYDSLFKVGCVALSPAALWLKSNLLRAGSYHVPPPAHATNLRRRLIDELLR